MPCISGDATDPSMPQPDSLPLLNALGPLLRTNHFGKAAAGYAVADSTNTLAATWASAQAPTGALIVAESQTAGRGRLGRTWHAQPGHNLLFSVVLRPQITPDRYGLLTLAASVAVAEVLSSYASLQPVAIKWPNDVLVDGRKCCGMLLETARATPPAVILGIGLNVNQTDFPSELQTRATSLRLTTGEIIPRAPLLADLLLALETWLAHTESPDGQRLILQTYERHLAGRGTSVTFRLTDSATPLQGTLAGIAQDGALLLQDGPNLRTFHAGEITFS